MKKSAAVLPRFFCPRKAQGMTQPQLAMACGTGIRFIVDLEAGKETCQLGKALLVAQMLGLNIGVAGQQ